MGLRFNPKPTPRFDQSLVPVVSENFLQLARLLAQIQTESIGASPPENPYVGQSWYDTADLTMKWWNGTGWSTWVAFTPAITQSVTLTKTINYSKYTIEGLKLTWIFDFTITSAGTAGQIVSMTLPLAAASVNGINGVSSYIDTGARNYGCNVFPQSTTAITGYPMDGNNLLGAFGIAGGAANTDQYRGMVVYELA